MRTPTWVLAVFLVLAGALTSRIYAETDDMTGAKVDDYVKSRIYVGILGTSAVIDQWNGFNGIHFLNSASSSGNTTQDFLPSITRQIGWGALAGYREGPWAAEVSFWRSDHTATFVSSGSITATSPASLQSINVDFKRYFLTKLPIQPYVNMGLSFPWLWVRQFSNLVDSSNNVLETDDETISGIGMNLGAGVEFYFENDFSIMGGVYQRWAEFDQVTGVDKAATSMGDLFLDGTSAQVGSVSGNGLQIYIGATVGIE